MERKLQKSHYSCEYFSQTFFSQLFYQQHDSVFVWSVSSKKAITHVNIFLKLFSHNYFINNMMLTDTRADTLFTRMICLTSISKKPIFLSTNVMFNIWIRFIFSNMFLSINIHVGNVYVHFLKFITSTNIHVGNVYFHFLKIITSTNMFQLTSMMFFIRM